MNHKSSRFLTPPLLLLGILLASPAKSGTLVGHPPGYCTQQLNTFTADLIGTAITSTGPVTLNLTNADLLWNPDSWLPTGTVSVYAAIFDVEIQVPNGPNQTQWIDLGDGTLEADSSDAIIWVSDTWLETVPYQCRVTNSEHPDQVGIRW